MADQDDPSNAVRALQDKIKENERKIKDLEEEVRKLQEKPKKHNEQKEETNRLKEKNKTLKEKIRKLEAENKELRTKIEDLEKRIKKLELSEDELIIRQLCSSVQKNFLKIVLQENFDEIGNKSTKYVEEYINEQIENEEERSKARTRWEKIKSKFEWDYHLIRQLNSLKKGGNETAHPSLTEERIERAKTNLKEKKILGKYNVKAVDKLKNIWKETNPKPLWNGPKTRSDRRARKRIGEDWSRMSTEHLPRKRLAEDRPETRSTEDRDRAGGPTRSFRSTSARGRSQDVSTSTVAGGRYDIPTRA